MYSFVEGEIIEKGDSHIVIRPDGMGLGLHVNVPPRTSHELPGIGESARLYTSFRVKEDSQALYGFMRQSERDLFDALLKISGVGGKTALAILDLPRDKIVAAIAAGDAAVLQQVQGVGAKTAGRIVLELKDKFAEELMVELAGIGLGDDFAHVPAEFSDGTGREFAEAVEALIELGYMRDEARKFARYARADLGESASASDLVRHALKSSG